MDVLSCLLILVAVILDVLATIKLVHSIRLSRKVKRLNIILTWLIPFIWAVFILSFSEKPPKKTGNHEKHSYMKTGYPMP